MTRLWLAVLAMLGNAATATAPAERARVALPAPPEAMPAAEYDWLLTITATDGRCTVTTIGPTTITAAHCLNGATGWTTDGDRAWQGPEPDWATSIPRGATLYAIGYPAKNGRQPVAYTLAALGTQPVLVGNAVVPVLMALGDGTPCTPGTSGMVAWFTDNGAARPVGPMSVYSIDPAVTSLPAGQYVCGFAL